MPRSRASQNYTGFANGFITEATGLTFPDGACQDIENMDIELKGSARRRLGVQLEPLGGPIGPYPSANSQDSVKIFKWSNPASDPDLDFFVNQIGNKLYIRNARVANPSNVDEITPLVTNPIIDISDFIFDGATTTNAAKSRMQAASGFGKLWVTSRLHYPFYLSYDQTTLTVTAHGVGRDVDYVPATSNPEDLIDMRIRDFKGVDDDLEVDENPATLTAEHAYNLYNQGWNNAQVTTYFSSQAEYPNNAQQWILGKDSNDDFDAALLVKQEFGNSPAPQGRAIYNPLLGSRDGVATLGGAGGTDDPITFLGAEDVPSIGGFEAVAFFSGRVWWSGDVNKDSPNGVFFSKTLQNIEDSAFYMQVNDPTSEHFFDLLDTDGGVIYIPEADSIKTLIPYLQGILVFANNGIWYIRGSDSGFRATDYGVDKISEVGAINTESIVRADKDLFFLEQNSVKSIRDEGGFPTVVDVAEERIRTFYNQLPLDSLRTSAGVYDKISKRVFWFYYIKDAETDSNTEYTYYVYNRALILDVRTGAYIKYRFPVDQAPTQLTGITAMIPAEIPLKPNAANPVTIDVDFGINLPVEPYMRTFARAYSVRGLNGSDVGYITGLLFNVKTALGSTTAITAQTDGLPNVAAIEALAATPANNPIEVALFRDQGYELGYNISPSDMVFATGLGPHVTDADGNLYTVNGVIAPYFDGTGIGRFSNTENIYALTGAPPETHQPKIFIVTGATVGDNSGQTIIAATTDPTLEIVEETVFEMFANNSTYTYEGGDGGFTNSESLPYDTTFEVDRHYFKNQVDATTPTTSSFAILESTFNGGATGFTGSTANGLSFLDNNGLYVGNNPWDYDLDPNSGFTGYFFEMLCLDEDTPDEAIPYIEFTQDVYFGMGGNIEIVVTADGELVSANEAFGSFDDNLGTNIILASKNQTTQLVNYNRFLSTQFLDFDDQQSTLTDDDKDYSSYIITRPETNQDLRTYQQAPYVQQFFEKTENFVVETLASNAPLGYDRESSCQATGLWDWRYGLPNERASATQQAYRYRKEFDLAGASNGDTVDNTENIVYSKLKVRGKGKSLSMRYESDTGKDFNLFGYNVEYSINQN